MAKKCPPGVVCVENNTMYFIVLFLAIVLSVIYFSVILNTKNSKSVDASQYSFSFPSPFNLDFIPKFGSGITYAKDMLNNPYVPPLKNENIYTSYGDIRPNVPINVSTRHYDSSYRQVGFLSPEAGGNGGHGNTLKDNLIPLMGRPLDRSRDKWNFYTINNSNNNLKLPIVHKGKSCTNEYGCDNLYNGDTVYVEGLKQPYKITMYDTDTMKYLPFL
jgi:hypothetical protein